MLLQMRLPHLVQKEQFDNTGGSIIYAGTVVRFTDMDAVSSRQVSVGSFTSNSGSFNLGTSGDNIYAYTGSGSNSASTWLAGIATGSGKYWFLLLIQDLL